MYMYTQGMQWKFTFHNYFSSGPLSGLTFSCRNDRETMRIRHTNMTTKEYHIMIVWCLTPFSTVFQLHHGGQCTYPFFPGSL